MPAPVVVAVVASAGGVEALKRLTSELPADLPAAVLVAVHLPPHRQSMLRGILDRHGALRVRNAREGELPEAGRIYVAQPDTHLLLVRGRLALGRGARENGHRPSHDAMLRSVALSAGPKAVGVVLTGMLDDGAVGLSLVERYGGTCIVQEPADADFASMPQHARDAVRNPRMVTLEDLAEEVVRAVHERTDLRAEQQWTDSPAAVPEEERARDELELLSSLGAPLVEADGSPAVGPSPVLGCPACDGVLLDVPDDLDVTEDKVRRFRCAAGHTWTVESLLTAQDERIEAALWTAVRALEERAQLTHSLAGEAELHGSPETAAHHRRRAEEAAWSAESLRSTLLDQVSREGSDDERA